MQQYSPNSSPICGSHLTFSLPQPPSSCLSGNYPFPPPPPHIDAHYECREPVAPAVAQEGSALVAALRARAATMREGARQRRRWRWRCEDEGRSSAVRTSSESLTSPGSRPPPMTLPSAVHSPFTAFPPHCHGTIQESPRLTGDDARWHCE